MFSIQTFARVSIGIASLAVSATLAGCGAAGPQDGEKSAGGDRSEEAFSANWYYSWGDTKQSSADIGPAAGRTCFMSGLTGNLRPGDIRYFADGYHPTQAGVRVNSSGHYEIFVSPTIGNPLQVYVNCVNAANTTAEVTWTGTAAFSKTVLAPVTGNRRCFLTQVNNVEWSYNSDGSTGWYGFGGDNSNDYVKIYNDGVNWYMGGQVAQGWFVSTARCFDVSQDDGSWLWIAPSNGTYNGQLSNVSGSICGLTGFSGSFNTYNDWNDGAYISYSNYFGEWFMNVKNGKGGWATCIK